MNLPLFIGLRYTRAKRKNHFISFISLISMAGIAIGVMTVIVVISVMNGFDKELKERMLGSVAHATISAYGHDYIQDWESAIKIAEENPGVVSAAPYVASEAMIQGYRTTGALVQGVSPEYEKNVTQLAEKMKYGSMEDLISGEYNIILGVDLAAQLGTGPGEKVVVYIPQFKTTAVGVLPRLKRFTVVGIFEMGAYEYDAKLALIHLNDAQNLEKTDGGIEGIRIKTTDLMKAPKIAYEIEEKLGGFLRVRDWTQENANFYKATQQERVVMFIILSMIIAVAAFNILSTMVMLVTEKNSDIAILRTLGMSGSQVTRIFIIAGVVIGAIGTIIGTALGLLISFNVSSIISWLEGFFEVDFMSSDVYYISDITADVHSSDVISIVVIAFTLTILATIYPAWRASRIQPAEALRYE
ncbi:MAG TPA: lipoprotein-releasing ABC transporter permease subunit [Gammaproteobacteria bacterium]|nr:lipoprotein-releasing ABC transporter permease subunit [Xanthomonadales bacterium]MCB1594387.1 lipoprotein-releasing ABC transporter permease subunit [Xanthomonadales bacterium]HOP22240.1 lipoprotein-releasing ABC transporter permease subunit [Gammaproteobacteria bacterium]HPI95288.1 lipoprotein-releasing ABC transporter permease subunit [Gammaproteobacteria bacterium]HPQ87262.1 lipoprotein-releasing ABC transporter permease subunit [Gammaproteobacteria bacterium]